MMKLWVNNLEDIFCYIQLCSCDRKNINRSISQNNSQKIYAYKFLPSNQFIFHFWCFYLNFLKKLHWKSKIEAHTHNYFVDEWNSSLIQQYFSLTIHLQKYPISRALFSPFLLLTILRTCFLETRPNVHLNI